MVMIKTNWIYGHCASVQKVGGLTGRLRLQDGELLMGAKHPNPLHYPCTTRRVVLVSGIIIKTKQFFTPMHVG